jgi:thiosulfate dehydrogenase
MIEQPQDHRLFCKAGFFLSFIVLAMSCTDRPLLRKRKSEDLWTGWNQWQIKPEDTLTRYGHDLISNTSYYLGPKGIVSQQTNGMNCQNCHYEAGTRPWGNNYGGVVSTYPKKRTRSGQVESIAKRVNDCFERSLNGKALDTTSREMRAIIAYMTWLGGEVPKGTVPKGTGIFKLTLMDRMADTVRGRIVYTTICATCHGVDGQGKPNNKTTGYEYPPLWGAHSFTTGAGLYRLSNFAGLAYMNMPFGQADHTKQVISAEQAWDVAAYVLSRPRPSFDVSRDWPDAKKRPIDDANGPYMDSFPARQHKYGPFKPIKTWFEKMNPPTAK